ncbi:MAG: hypothetical protein ACRD9Q_05090 [Nitrososphaeraceae archaeon]
MSANEMDLESKVRDWANKNPKWDKFKDNMKMLKALYANYNIASSIAECVKGCKAAFDVVVTKDLKRKALTLCSKCFRKQCDQGTCGADDYQEFNPHAYTVLNNGDTMMIEITPFATGIDPLEVDQEYAIEGVVNTFQNKKGEEITTLSLTKATRITKSEIELNEKALKTAEQVMQIGTDGRVEKEKFDTLMAGYGTDQINAVMQKLNLKVDGQFIVRS